VTRLLSLTSCHTDDGPGMSVTPAPSGGAEPPGRLPPAPGSHGDLSGCSTFARGIPLSRSLHLTSRSGARVSLTAHPSSGPLDPSPAFRREQSRRVLGMHTTPDNVALSAPPGRLPSCAGTLWNIDVIRYGQAV